VRKLIVSAAVALLVSLSLAAQAPDSFDARLESELRALDPAAVPAWTQANAAREAGKSEEAIRFYGQVFERVPTFHHALRRQAGEHSRLGHRQQAITLSRRALAMERSPENLAALAGILVEVPNGTASNAEAMEATGLIAAAAVEKPDDPYVQQTRAAVAIAMQDLEALRSAAEKLLVLAPKEPNTHVFRYLTLAMDGDVAGARAELDQAAMLGLPKEAYDSMRSDLDAATPFYVRWWKPVALAVGIWFGGFALLLGAGALLSRIAVRAAREVPVDLSANATGLSARLRRTYSAVLFLSSLFYYVSIPVVIGLVLLLGGGLIYAAFALGRIPVKLVLMAAILVIVTIWSILKSLFVRVDESDPGMRLDLSRHPRLRALLDEVAQRIGTRAVDNVYLTPGTDVAVMERGKQKSKERCLILGVAGLDGLAIRSLKAVLGHEYGHFTNRDTAGGAFALRVRNSMNATAFALANGGAAAWYNPGLVVRQWLQSGVPADF
jgi:tetratricopeptide (TPR) repeat protein